MLTAETRLVALVGHPVAHSLSPRMQNAAFAARGLDWAYLALDVPPERLEEALHGLAAGGFAGANVTIPHKRAAAAICDEADGDAVNTLVFADGRILGFNTDKEILRGIDARRVCLIGAGGAAGTLLPGLTGEVRQFSRRGEWPPDAEGCDLIVNSTPVRDELLVEPHRGQTVVELAYSPDGADTKLVAAARIAGCEVVDGLEALVRQGAAAFERWTGLGGAGDGGVPTSCAERCGRVRLAERVDRAAGVDRDRVRSLVVRHADEGGAGAGCAVRVRRGVVDAVDAPVTETAALGAQPR
jgi:shikimate dehydrogenase